MLWSNYFIIFKQNIRKFYKNKILMNGVMNINPHGWRSRWAARAAVPRLYGFNTKRLRAASRMLPRTTAPLT